VIKGEKGNLKIFALFIFLFLQTTEMVFSSPIQRDGYSGLYPGARSCGMGCTGIALVNEPVVSFYNPAGLCFLIGEYVTIDFQNNRDATSEQDGFMDVSDYKFDFFSFASSGAGISFRPLSRVDRKLQELVFSEEYSETVSVESRLEYSADEFCLSVTSVASEMFETLENKPLFGINLKYIRASLGSAELVKLGSSPVDASSNIDSGNGFGLDIGFAYSNNPVTTGIVLKDVFSKVFWSDYDSDRITPRIGAGASLKFFKKWNVCTDLNYDTGNKKLGSSSGVEFSNLGEKATKAEEKIVDLIKKKEGNRSRSLFSARLGMALEDVEKRSEILYSAGCGYSFNRFQLNVAVFGNNEQIRSKELSSQVSILVVY